MALSTNGSGRVSFKDKMLGSIPTSATKYDTQPCSPCNSALASDNINAGQKGVSGISQFLDDFKNVGCSIANGKSVRSQLD